MCDQVAGYGVLPSFRKVMGNRNKAWNPPRTLNVFWSRVDLDIKELIILGSSINASMSIYIFFKQIES